MGVEVGKFEGFEVAQAPYEPVIKSDGSAKEDENLDKQQGQKVAIKFGSHGEEHVKTVDNSAFVPKEAAAEWPAAKQIHTFYFVRFRPYDDPKLKARIDQADREIQRLNQTRFQIIEELKAKRAERTELFDQLEPLKSERKGFNSIFDEKRKEMEPLQQALGKLRSSDGAGRGSGLCSSEEELDDLIYSLQYRMQHESIPLNEEKRLLKEIKQLEGTRDKVIANAAMRAKIKESLGQKEDIQDQVKLMGVDLDGVKKERQAITAKIGRLGERLKTTKEEIVSLEEELKNVIDKRDKAFANIQELRKQRDEGNAGFYQSRTVLNKAKELAATKNVNDLEEYSQAEVEKFMSWWNSSKTFRDDYKKRILSSLDGRQLSHDGRMRNPDEKPLTGAVTPSVSETGNAAKTSANKAAKEATAEPKVIPKLEAAPVVPQVVQKESKNVKETKSGEDGYFSKAVNEVVKKDKEEVDEAKLKALKREEELAKAKQAMERKKKLAEKAAAKAAIRAQKEAEKKILKKSKKKAAGNGGVDGEKGVEAATEGNEAEKVDVEDLEVVDEKEDKEKSSKEKTVRYRGGGKVGRRLPKAVLKRKKSTDYKWVWISVAVGVALMLLALLVYFYAL